MNTQPDSLSEPVGWTLPGPRADEIAVVTSPWWEVAISLLTSKPLLHGKNAGPEFKEKAARDFRICWLMLRNSEERFLGSVSTSFSPHKRPKKPFSVFERSILPKVGEKERTPFVFCSNPHHVQNPRLGTRFETVCGRFYANQHVFPLSLLRLKRIVGPGRNATFRNALYFRYMVVLIESARILRLSSIL